MRKDGRLNEQEVRLTVHCWGRTDPSGGRKKGKQRKRRCTWMEGVKRGRDGGGVEGTGKEKG